MQPDPHDLEDAVRIEIDEICPPMKTCTFTTPRLDRYERAEPKQGPKMKSSTTYFLAGLGGVLLSIWVPAVINTVWDTTKAIDIALMLSSILGFVLSLSSIGASISLAEKGK